MVAQERRGAPRWTPGDTRLLDARIRAGGEARIVDCSATGVRLVTSMRLMPGRRCVVVWTACEGTPAAAGTVVRSAVGQVDSAAVRYLVAIALDRSAPFLGIRTTQGG